MTLLVLLAALAHADPWREVVVSVGPQQLDVSLATTVGETGVSFGLGYVARELSTDGLTLARVIPGSPFLGGPLDRAIVTTPLMLRRRTPTGAPVAIRLGVGADLLGAVDGGLWLLDASFWTATNFPFYEKPSIAEWVLMVLYPLRTELGVDIELSDHVVVGMGLAPSAKLVALSALDPVLWQGVLAPALHARASW